MVAYNDNNEYYHINEVNNVLLMIIMMKYHYNIHCNISKVFKTKGYCL